LKNVNYERLNISIKASSEMIGTPSFFADAFFEEVELTSLLIK
jgi:hypothetical protein